MVKKRFEPVRVNITGLHVDGYGLTEDPKLCVLGTLPGETVTALAFTKKRRKIFAKPVEIHESSVDRIEPMCAAAEFCGGCSLQHFASDKQIQFKHKELVETLGTTQPIEFFQPLVGPVRNYRSKARLGVKFVEKKNRVLVGFREKMKPYIAEITSCPVLREPVSQLIPALVELISSLSILKAVPQIEVSIGDLDAALVFRHLEPLSSIDLDLMRLFSEENDVDVYLQPGNAESVHKLAPTDNVERLYYQLPDFDLSFAFHPLDFTQVNHVINQKMLHVAIKLLDLQFSDRVFDGFCGIGNFSLALAKRAEFVIGVESSQSSVVRAQENALRNGIKNCEFIVSDLFRESIELPALQGINKVLLDPPRSGALEVCKKLARHKVERVVYVSCNPVTLARDAAILVESGYQFEGAGVIDMFPQTTHVESIACFSR